MKILTLLKYGLLFGALGFLIHYHTSRPNDLEDSESTTTATDYQKVFSAAYTAYYPSSIKAAKEKTVQYAEILYKKDLAEGKTKDEFKGLTVISYCFEALDDKQWEEEITQTDRLALAIPVILSILVIIAIIISIHLGFSSIRPLDFDNEAVAFKK